MSDLTRPTTPRSDSWKRDFPSPVDLTSDYDHGLEAMRSACIKSVKEIYNAYAAEPDEYSREEYALYLALCALHEVQP